MPNHEIIRAWDEGYAIGQRDLRKDLCPSCAAKGVPAAAPRPTNVLSMIEFVQRRRGGHVMATPRGATR